MRSSSYFFFNDTATTEIYTLSLHDALPIFYSEMKMCLAPCFSGCTKEEYDVEVNRLVEFLETSGGSLRTAFEQERERASEQLDFERARTLHKKEIGRASCRERG